MISQVWGYMQFHNPQDPCILYMVTFTSNIPPGLAYIPAPWNLHVPSTKKKLSKPHRPHRAQAEWSLKPQKHRQRRTWRTSDRSLEVDLFIKCYIIVIVIHYNYMVFSICWICWLQISTKIELQQLQNENGFVGFVEAAFMFHPFPSPWDVATNPERSKV